MKRFSISFCLAALGAAAIALLTAYLAAMAQTNPGQLPAWGLVGNPSGTPTSALSAATVSTMLDGAFGGCATSTVATRSSSAWGCTLPLPQCANIASYGGKGDNSTDNVGPYNAAIAGNKCIYFPAGKYVFSGAPNAWTTTTALNSVAIVGDGADVTELTFPATGTAFTINLASARHSFHLRNFSITTGTNGASGGFAFNITQNGSIPAAGYDAPNEISGVTVRGSDGYFAAGSNYWATGVIITNVSNVSWINDYFIGPGTPNTAGYVTLGTAAVVQGTFSGGTCTTYPVAHNFVASYFNQYGTGVQIGNCVQGLAFTSVNMTGGQFGVHIPPGLQPGLTEFAAIGSQFNEAAGGIRFETFMNNVTISGNTFYVLDPLMSGAGSVGVALLAGIGSYVITGNTFNLIGNGALNGLVLDEDMTMGWYSVVSNNIFFNSSAANGTGIFLQSGAKSNFITGNSFSALTTNVANAGTNNFLWNNNPEFTYTVAQLLALTCGPASRGRILILSDAAAAAATYAGAVAAGSNAVNTPVSCDGATWRYH